MWCLSMEPRKGAGVTGVVRGRQRDGKDHLQSGLAPLPAPNHGEARRGGVAAGPARTSGATAHHLGFDPSELIDDYRLACTSRALDDREIVLQKQSRVFFQISGAGHEILLLALARSLRPGYDWFFPYYRDQALCLALGVTPRDILLQAVGSAEDPSSGGRQMPSHWGSKRLNIVSQTSPTGSQCLPAVGCAEAARYIAPRQLVGCHAMGDEITYVSLGDGATSEGEFWESLNTACRLHLPVLFLVADNGYAVSVRSADQAPAPISELVNGFRGLTVTKVDGTDYFSSRQKGPKRLPVCGPRRGRDSSTPWSRALTPTRHRTPKPSTGRPRSSWRRPAEIRSGVSSNSSSTPGCSQPRRRRRSAMARGNMSRPLPRRRSGVRDPIRLRSHTASSVCQISPTPTGTSRQLLPRASIRPIL